MSATSPPTPSFASPSLPIPITQSVSRPSSPHGRPSRPTQIKPVSPMQGYGVRDSILAQAIRHNDLRLLVENQERVRSAATSNSRPSSASRGPSRSRATMPAFGSTALETDSEASGESADVQIADLRLGERPDRAPSVARCNTSASPARGPSARSTATSGRRLSSLATYTGVLPGQSPVRSSSARAASPELRYSIPLAGRRTSVPSVPATAAPRLERRLSATAGRPPSPAPPGFKTSFRPGGPGPAGLSPISPSPSSVATRHAASAGPASGRTRSRSPAPSGLVCAASPSPTSPPSTIRTHAGLSSSSVRSPGPRTARTASPAPGPTGATGPLVIRGFDIPALAQSPHMQQQHQQPALPPSPSVSARTLGLGIRHSKSHHAAAGPIVRPPSVLLDRTADQRLEVAASRDIERIDDYYASRYAAANAAAQTGEAGRFAGMSGTASRDQRLQKRAAEERLRRGYDRVGA